MFVALRAARGFAVYDYWQFGRNLDFLGLLPPGYDPYYRAYAWFVVALFGPLAWLAVTVRQQLPWFPRHVPIVAIPFVVVAVTLSSIIETRIFTPLFPLLIRRMFAVFRRKRRVPTGTETEAVYQSAIRSRTLAALVAASTSWLTGRPTRTRARGPAT